jgi:AcrR family transcriptional regulator
VGTPSSRSMRPSLYKHVPSKQDRLARIMAATMEHLLAAHQVAIFTTNDPVERLRRATAAHVRYDAWHRYKAFVGSREIRSLVEPHHTQVVKLRADYENCFRRPGPSEGWKRPARLSRRIASSSAAVAQLNYGPHHHLACNDR